MFPYVRKLTDFTINVPTRVYRILAPAGRNVYSSITYIRTKTPAE